jgi:hypothetical protein
MLTRTNETLAFPTIPCPEGIMVNVRFPTCWDGVNLDAPDHMGHVAYPGMYSNLTVIERVLVSTCLFM